MLNTLKRLRENRDCKIAKMGDLEELEKPKESIFAKMENIPKVSKMESIPKKPKESIFSKIDKIPKSEKIFKIKQKKIKLFYKPHFILDEEPNIEYEFGEPTELGIRLVKPYVIHGYQSNAVKFALDRENGIVTNPRFIHKGCVWWIEMGLGKTFMSGLLISQPHDLPTLFITERGLLDSTLQEFRKFFGFQLRIHVHHTLNIRTFNKVKFDDFDLVISTYATAANSENITNQQWYRVIIDESHTLRNRGVKVFSKLRDLHSPRRLCMTGTPIHNFVNDIFAQLELIGLRVSASLRKTPGMLTSLGLMQFILTINREEVESVVLPPKFVHIIKFDLSSNEKFIHAHFLNHIEKEKGLHQSNFLRALQVCTAPYLLTLASLDKIEKPERVYFSENPQVDTWLRIKNGDAGMRSSKMMELHKLLIELAPRNEKIIVFANYAAPLRLAIASLGMSNSVFQESVVLVTHKSGSREKLFHKFKTDPNCMMLFTTLRMGGRGLNLTEASIVIFLQNWFCDSAHAQGESRVHRIGQTKKVDVYYLIANNSVEEHVMDLANGKKELSDHVYGLHDQPEDCSDSD